MREENTVNELSSKHGISPVVIGRWKAEFLEKASEVFRKGPSNAEQDLAEKEEHIAELERKVSQLTIEVMHKIDAIHTAHPTFGYRKITDILCKDDLINHKRVQRLMRAMDIITIYPKPNLSKRYHAQYVKHYLLRNRNLKIVRPNQV